MDFTYQTIIVALIVLVALVFLGRKIISAARGKNVSCGCGCDCSGGKSENCPSRNMKH